MVDNSHKAFYYVILRLFFFPNYLNEAAAGADKEDYVSRELILRAGGDSD